MCNSFKRLMSAFMAIAMVTTLIPSQAFAESKIRIGEGLSVLVNSFDPDFIEESDLEQQGDFLPADASDGGAEETVPAASLLSGRIIDIYGQGMVDVSVQIYDRNESALLAPCMTDQSGAWSSAGYTIVEGHTYALRFYKAGYSFNNNLLEYVAMPGENDLGETVAVPAGIEMAVCSEVDYLFSISDDVATITGYIGHDPAIITPVLLGGYPVIEIGGQAFQNNDEITSVYISNGIKTIGNEAFAGCTALREVTFPNGLEHLGEYAFIGCGELEHSAVEIPDGAFVSNTAFDNGNNIPGCSSDPADRADSIIPDTTQGNEFASLMETNGDFSYQVLDGTYCAITGYSGSNAELVVPSQIGSYIVQRIADGAFQNNTAIVSVTLPDSLESVGTNVFRGCTNLVFVDFGQATISALSNNMFDSCTALNAISWPQGLTTLGSYMFSGCTSLTSISIPTGVTTINDHAFYNCTALTEVSLPETLKTIYAYAFENCPFTSIDIPDSVTTLAGRAFYNCMNLAEVGYPKSWSDTSPYQYSNCSSPFEGCSALKTITVDEGAASIPVHAFRNQTALEVIHLPGSVTAISEYAFSGCTSLKTVSGGEGLKTIKSRGFQNCTGLAAITLPESLTQIEEYAFENSGLTSVSVPGGVTAINNHVFYNCRSLTKVELQETLTSIAAYAFENCPFEQINIPDSVATMAGRAFYNCTKLANVGYPKSWSDTSPYQYSNCSSPFEGCAALKEITVDDGVTAIPVHAFRNQKSLETVSLPDSVTTIAAYAFSDCTALKTVNWSVNLSAIGDHAFYGCGSLTNITLPGKLTTINTNAFQNCTGLTALTLPESLTTINASAFENCSGLKNVAVPSGVTTVNNTVFKNCTGLRTVTLPSTLTSIAPYAFENCQFTAVDIPDSVTTLAGRAFYNCTKLANVGYPKSWSDTSPYQYSNYSSPFEGCAALREITVGAGVTAIPAHAFRNQTTVETVTLPDSVETIGSRAFDGCTALRSVNWGAGLEAIGSYAFQNCTALSEFSPPDSLRTIDTYAFSGCKGFRLLTLNENLETIGTHAFDGCAGLLSLTLNENLQTLSAQAFANCSNLVSARIPKAVAAVDNTSFQNCPKVTIYCYSGSPAHYAAQNGKHTIVLLDDHEHTFEDTIATEATCTREGSKIRTCTLCGYYYTELLDALGHDYAVTLVEATCTDQGYTLHECSRCGNSYQDTYVDAPGHSYGDWLIETPPTPVKEGSRYRDCIRCDDRETQIIPKADLNDSYGQITFTVVNARSPDLPIQGAQIFAATAQDGNFSAVTDDQGKATLVLPVGKHSIAVAASGFMTRNFTLNVAAGENASPLIGLSDKPVYEATITHREMTIEEIEAAGIDTSAPANQHVYKYELKLTFVPEIDWLSLTYFMDAEGFIIKGLDIVPIGPDGPGPGPDDDRPGGETSPSQPRTVIWIPPSTNGPNRGGHFHIPAHGDEQEMDIYPVSENFYLIIRGEVRWLKEMFDVEMLVVNNSLTDTMEDVTATLALPEEGGLSLATMVEEKGAQTLRQDLGTIPGGESRSVHWYVRGDSAGSYSISARLQGVLKTQGMEDTPIDDLFLCPEPLQVLAGNALHLHFEFPGVAYYGEDYPITITLTNTSGKSLYNVSHKVQIIQGMEYYYSDGSSKKRIEPSEWIQSGVLREFKPGDKIIMETSVNIFFKSEIMQRELEKLTSMVDCVEQFMTGFKMVETGLDLFGDMTDVVDNGSKAVDLLVSGAASQMGSGKTKLVGQLQEELSALREGYSGSEGSAFDAIGKLGSAGISGELESLAENPDTWLQSRSEEEIGNLVSDLAAVNNSLQNPEKQSRPFNIYDSIRTAISAIPVCFVLKSVVMTEDPNNTTSIPWDYTITNSGPHYFGVASVSKYFRALAKAAIGELYEDSVSPFYRAISGGSKVTANKEEAIRYIQAVEDEIAAFKAKDATGEVKYKVWWAHGDGSGVTPLSAETGGFQISCDSANASTDANGVLTFTGDATISVMPQKGTESGVLYVESTDTDGTTSLSTYVLNVVPQHTCVKGALEQVVAPSAGHEGFGTYCCDICGEVMEVKSLSQSDLCETHTFGDWQTETKATHSAGGVQRRTCSVCGAVEYQYTDKRALLPTDVSISQTGQTETSRTVSLTNLSKSTLPVQFVAAAYDEYDRMIGVGSVRAEVLPNETIDLTVAYTAKERVASVKAFLLDQTTLQPLCEAAEIK